MRTLFAFAAALAAGSSFAAWSTKTIDLFGVVPINEVCSDQSALKRIGLIDLSPQDQYAYFKKEYTKDPADTIAAYGFVLSAQKCGRSKEALETSASEFYEFIQPYNKPSFQGTIPVPASYGTAYAAALSMAKFHGPKGSDISQTPGTRASMFGDYILRAVPNGAEMSRAQVMLFASSHLENKSFSGVRRVLRAYLAKHPKDGAAHLYLSSAYSMGYEGMADSHGKPMDVPADQSPRFDLEAEEAKLARQYLPDSKPGLYYIGLHSAWKNPSLTKQVWGRYLQLRKGDAEDRFLTYVKGWIAEN